MRLLGCFEYNQQRWVVIKKKAPEDEFELPGDGEAEHMAATIEEDDDSADE